MKSLRLGLLAVGTLVWIPYLICKYALETPFSVGWVLLIHVPCMVGALILRLVAWRRRKADP